MTRPKLLDTYCCQGGASEGYRRAGFDVYGIDRFMWTDADGKRRGYSRDRYPFPSWQGDVLEAMAILNAGGTLDFAHPDGTVESLGLADFAVLAGSPPCQPHSITKHSHNVHHDDFLPQTREAFRASGLPYVIENVEGAPMVEPMTLCGSEFDLRAVDDDGTPLWLKRHRLFESNVFLIGNGGCRHPAGMQCAGAYGGGSVDRAHAKDVRRGGYTPGKHIRGALLGIDWMTQDALSQSIPPAYTEHIGRQLIEHIASERAA